MIKNMAWNMFKNTGNIDTFLEFKQIKDIEDGNVARNNISNLSNINMQEVAKNDGISTIQKAELNGNNKNQWNNNF